MAELSRTQFASQDPVSCVLGPYLGTCYNYGVWHPNGSHVSWFFLAGHPGCAPHWPGGRALAGGTPTPRVGAAEGPGGYHPALTRTQVAPIWRLGTPLRDKALAQMLYKTAAVHPDEILGLDRPDLDLPGKPGRVISRGGAADWVYWQAGTAMLLPRLLAPRWITHTARCPARARLARRSSVACWLIGVATPSWRARRADGMTSPLTRGLVW